MKNNILSCEFNIDTACVEVKFDNGSMVSINCIAIENEYANKKARKSESVFYFNYLRLSKLSRISSTVPVAI